MNKIINILIAINRFGVKSSNTDIDNRSIQFTNTVFVIILCMQTYALLSEISTYSTPSELVWDQWSIPFMILYSAMSLMLNKLNFTLFVRVLLLIVWPSVTYILPIILQNTPTDYYLGYPIALIFHGILIQITLPFRQYKLLLSIFMLINTVLMFTFADFLIRFDDMPEAVSAITGNKFYYINGVIFWLAINITLAFLLRYLNLRIDEIIFQKEIYEAKNKELEAAFLILAERQKQLVHSEKMASLVKLSSGLAHQVNNPLNYIMGARDLLLKQFKEDDRNDKIPEELFEMMSSGISRIQNIVKNLGLLTATSATQAEYSEKIYLHELIQTTILSLRTADTDHVLIRNIVDEELVIKQNPVLLTQILYQVLINASDSIQTQGEILVSYNNSENKGCILVEDNGKGMSEEELKKCQDPFFTTKETGKSTGLGLFIATSIINELNGVMNIESKQGIGTKVQICIPVNK